MKRPGYNASLEYAHTSLHKQVDMWALSRHVGGGLHTPFSGYALNTTFKNIIRAQSSTSSGTIDDPVAFADWLTAECRPSRSYRDRCRKQLQYAAKAWGLAAVCFVAVVAVKRGLTDEGDELGEATEEDIVEVTRVWLLTTTAEDRAALMAVWRLSGAEGLRDFMGPTVGSLRLQAARRAVAGGRRKRA